MGKFQNLVGQRFGRLTVMQKSSEKKGTKICWDCVCDCGNFVRSVAGCNLKRGFVNSCGCFRRETITRRNTKHGMSRTRLHRIWSGMRSRCFNNNDKSFKDYGGRGITVCDEWKDDFQAFHDWAITNGYSDDLTIERNDVNDNYCPENCLWITNQEQQNNRRSSHLLTYNGETHNLKEWAKITGINYSTLRARINAYKWDTAKALTTKEKRGNKS